MYVNTVVSRLPSIVGCSEDTVRLVILCQTVLYASGSIDIFTVPSFGLYIDTNRLSRGNLRLFLRKISSAMIAYYVKLHETSGREVDLMTSVFYVERTRRASQRRPPL